MRTIIKSIVIGFFCFSILTKMTFAQTVKVGSKHFNESYILAEIMSQLLEDRGFDVERHFGLGGTLICYQALLNGEIDVYPEYSGTIEQAILKLPGQISYKELQTLLAKKYRLHLLDSFGFSNTYALTTRAAFAGKNHITSISDLRFQKNLRFGLSYEYIERGDGWKALADFYGLHANPIGMEHALSYKALEDGKIDVMDVYSTDAEIQKYDLVLLKDDKQFFPVYLAAPLLRSGLDSSVQSLLAGLHSSLNEEEMQRLNAQVAIDGKTFAEAAHGFLLERNFIDAAKQRRTENRWRTLADKTLTHLFLTAVALFAAIIVAVPLGMFIYKLPNISAPVIYFVGLLQTIPSLALLALMIPLFGIGVKPALVALFLYALLPILRNTYIALTTIDPILKKVSIGMGLTDWQRLRYIELPLAMPTMLAGIRTAAVILIGTATIAAFIGAGGLGEYIVTGLSLNDPTLIMWGAIPAAILAILVEFAFEWLEKQIVPKHLSKQKKNV